MRLFIKFSFLLVISILLNACGAQRKATAASHIKNVKNTAVLVRLQTFQSRIDYFNKRGQTDKAIALEKEVEFSNKELIRAFKKEFDFCPVYFFYSYDAKKVKKGDFADIFLNDALEVTQPESLPEQDNFYVVGFDGANVDTEYNLARSKLVVMDHNFKSLKQPFPYYHGYYYTRLPAQALKLMTDAEYQSKESSEAKAVYLLNKSFNRYYDKVIG